MAAYRTNLPLNTYLTDLLRYFFIAFIIRSSACTVNDMFDRKIDAGVGEEDLFFTTHVRRAHSSQREQKTDLWQAVESRFSQLSFTSCSNTPSELGFARECTKLRKALFVS